MSQSKDAMKQSTKADYLLQSKGEIPKVANIERDSSTLNNW